MYQFFFNYFFFRNSNNIEILSCTDKECGWKKKQQTVLNNYNPTPLLDHECFSAPKKSAIIKDAFKLMENKERTETVEEELIDEINKTTASNTTKENNKNKTALST